MKTKNLILISIGLVFLEIGCNRTPDFELEILLPLSQITMSKEFPHTPTAAMTCKTASIWSCKPYQEAHSASLALLDINRRLAFKKTIQAFERTCPAMFAADTNVRTREICVGSLEAFYFFSSDSEDRELVRALSSHPGILSNIFHRGSFQFLKNRTNKELWDKFVESAFAIKDGQNPIDTAFVDGFDPVYLLKN